MRRVHALVCCLALAIAACAETKAVVKGPGHGDTRAVTDDVGYATNARQIESVVRLAEEIEKGDLARWTLRATGSTPFAAISPHDDYLYAAQLYVLALKPIAGAKTVVIFGVTHKDARKALDDPEDIVIFDDYLRWNGPYGPVDVDTALRSFIIDRLPNGHAITSAAAHQLEHSIEAMVPFLQHYNRQVRIVPIMVTRMSFEKMEQIAAELADILASYMTDKGLQPGKDISFVISADLTHYGPDFEYAPFGVAEASHDLAVTQDVAIIDRFLKGPVDATKLKGFADKVWGGKIPWCGRYSIPFGLFTVSGMAAAVAKKPLVGESLKYLDSYTLGTFPLYGIGLGTTAPFSLKHWVGYTAILYGTEPLPPPPRP